MQRLVKRPGFAAASIGTLILVHLAVVAMVLRADREFVYIGDHALPEACSLRKVYGIPCPTCGMTRGAVLALHGHVGESMATNAAAPVLIGVALLLGLTLATAGGLKLAGRERAAAWLTRWVRRAGLTGGALWVVALAANWIVTLRSLPS
jgi:hypothetical protein